ncbi:MAG TPA: hypothetical protein VFP59_14025 [Candidatus Angelobacter sp.]|nr:hypothetical protein [Candidatus Angelobacter sp.]
MSDATLNLLIQAQSGNAEETLNQFRESLDRSQTAAKLLSDVLGGDVKGALSSAAEATKAFGLAVDIALSPVDVVAFAGTIADVADKLSKVIADNFIYTDQQKALDAQLRSSNQTIVGLAAGINNLDEQYKRLGKTASQNTAIDIGELQPQLDQAKEKVENLSNKIFMAKDEASDRDSWVAKAAKEELPALTIQLGVAQQQLIFFEKQMRNLKKIFSLQKASELGPMRQQANEQQAITVQAQKDRIDKTQLASQQVITDYQQSFATINASAQQFNSQQLSILMTGINNNSNQIIQATEQFHKKLQAQEAEAQQQRAKLWDQTFKGISGTFTTFINGIVSGHQTLSQAWVKMVDGMVTKFIDGLEKQLMSFAEHKLMELTINAETEAAKDQASQAAHAKEDERTAYSAAKAAWESVVHTPLIGPILAPIAAASTFAAVSAFGSAEGGQYLVPAEQLTMLHRNEMVLPAGVADRMRGVIEGGGGGGVTVVVNHSVSAVDAESFQAHLRRHANLIGQEVGRVLRKRTA